MNEKDIIQNVILFEITLEQAEKLCKHYNKNLEELDTHDLCDLLDKYIDEIK